MKAGYIALMIVLLSATMGWSQTNIKGQIKDQEGHGVVAANVSIYSIPDSSFVTGTMTDTSGNFSIELEEEGKMMLKTTYIGLLPYVKNFTAEDGKTLEVGVIELQEDEEVLETVEVKDRITRVEMNGDTTEFNVNALKLNQSAVLEDVIKQLPGVTFQNGQLMANGQPVTRITIDGQDFFGNDVVIALKNLPAEMIDKIQIFAQNDDKNNTNVIQEQGLNLVTKDGMKKGIFGRLSAGAGTQNRFLGDGMLNFFKPKTRLTVFFMSNNINQQNFDFDEVTQNTEQGYESFYNLYAGNDDGIATTSALGLNFNHKFKKGVQLGLSYLINYRDLYNTENSREQYFNTTSDVQEYNQESDYRKYALQQIISSSIRWDRDSTIEFRFQPKFSIFNQSDNTSLTGINSLDGVTRLNQIMTALHTENSGWKSENEFRFNYKFRKNMERRIRASGEVNYENNTSLYQLNSENYYYQNDSTDLIRQNSDAINKGWSADAQINYTEPFGDLFSMGVGFNFDYENGTSNWETFEYNPMTNKYDLVDTSLTNNFKRNEAKYAPQLSFHFNNKSINAWAGVRTEFSQIFLEQDFPTISEVSRDFFNVLPYAGIRFQAGRAFTLSLWYHTRTDLPSTSQLQPLVNNVNPLFISTGNPNLNRTYRHSVGLYLRGYHQKTSQSYSAHISYNYEMDYLGKSRYLITADTIINGVNVGEGVQFSLPQNFESAQRLNYFFNYTIPISKAGFSVNFTTNGAYNLYPGLVNGLESETRSFNTYNRLALNSTFSQEIQIELAGGMSYNLTINNLQSRNNEYFNYFASLGAEYESKFGLHIQSEVEFNSRQGLGSEFDRNVFLWTAELGYRFFKKNTLEVSIGAYDILNQNVGIYRNVDEVKIRDVEDTVLKQFFYLKLTWNLRFFKGGATEEDAKGGGGGRYWRHH